MIIGILAINWSLMAMAEATIAVSALLFIAGGLHLFEALFLRRARGNRLNLLQAAVALLSAWVIFRNPSLQVSDRLPPASVSGSLSKIRPMVMGYLFFNGAVRSWLAQENRSQPGRTWLGLTAIVGFAFAIILLLSPPSASSTLPGTLVGLDLFIYGACLIGIARAAQSPEGRR
jgi:uncharacterized membrane protein HdeD (DUF308 family)